MYLRQSTFLSRMLDPINMETLDELNLKHLFLSSGEWNHGLLSQCFPPQLFVKMSELFRALLQQ